MTSSNASPNPLPEPERIAALMAGDGRFEPPADALARARDLRARIAARATGSRPLLLGELLDRAAAIACDWLQGPAPALAGLRDDRGAELLDARVEAATGAPYEIHCERTVFADGRSRLVGEVVATDGTALRARVLALAADDRVVATAEVDALGLFAIELDRRATAIAVEHGEPPQIVVLPLAATDGDA